MMIKKICVMLLACVLCFTLAGCANGKIIKDKHDGYTGFRYVKEEDIGENVQIIELSNSEDFYEIEAAEDAENVYFYSIGYDRKGKLADKSIISTMPTGISKGEKIAVNVTIPDTKTPVYAIGFFSKDMQEKYYILEYDKKEHGKMTPVKNREELMLDDE